MSVLAHITVSMTSISPSHDPDANSDAAVEAQGAESRPDELRVLPAAFLIWLAVWGVLVFAKQPFVAYVVFSAGFLIPWFAILAVAWLVPPPRPLAETRLLAQRLIWVVRAGWTAVVFGGSAIVSTTVALRVEANANNPDVWDDVLGYVLMEVVFPVFVGAAYLASGTLPFQLDRTAHSDRERAVRSLVKPLAQLGLPTVSLERFITEVTLKWVAIFFCHLGPMILIAATNIAWTYLNSSGTASP